MEFLDLSKKIQIREEIITSAELIEAATATNSYIKSLVSAFDELGFDIFYSLGQRNISGFVGEIFKHILAAKHEGFIANPHPDGRPDILSVDTKEIRAVLLQLTNALFPLRIYSLPLSTVDWK